jgi:hypothetical protein
MIDVIQKIRYFEEKANFTFRNSIRYYFSLNSSFCAAVCAYVLEKDNPDMWAYYHNKNQWMFFRNQINIILSKMLCENIQSIIQENIKVPFVSWLIKKHLHDELGFYLIKFHIDLQTCRVDIQCQIKREFYINPKYFILEEKYLKELNLQKYKKEYTLCSPYSL